jgi:hypothetical protein
MSHVVTVPELLDGHAVLDIECLDRVYLNGYVPSLQAGGQVIGFLHSHLGMKIASPVVLEQIGTRFRQAVARFAENNDIPLIKFKNGMRKIDVMRPLLEQAARQGQPGVVAIGWAQEYQHVWEARKRDTDPSRPPQFSFAIARRRVTCYYFYLWDQDFGGAFIKICAYFPYPVKVWVNGHEWAAAGQSWDRVHRAVQRVRILPGPPGSTGRLRPARARRHHCVLRAVDVAHPAAADRC